MCSSSGVGGAHPASKNSRREFVRPRKPGPRRVVSRHVIPIGAVLTPEGRLQGSCPFLLADIVGAATSDLTGLPRIGYLPRWRPRGDALFITSHRPSHPSPSRRVSPTADGQMTPLHHPDSGIALLSSRYSADHASGASRSVFRDPAPLVGLGISLIVSVDARMARSGPYFQPTAGADAPAAG